jgi:hypothetical protein
MLASHTASTTESGWTATRRNGTRKQRGSAAILWAAGVILLMPLIVVAGLLAFIGTLALSASRRTPARATQAREPTLATVVHLEARAAEVSLGQAA